jgi:hypothetical protein
LFHGITLGAKSGLTQTRQFFARRNTATKARRVVTSSRPSPCPCTGTFAGSIIGALLRSFMRTLDGTTATSCGCWLGLFHAWAIIASNRQYRFARYHGHRLGGLFLNSLNKRRFPRAGIIGR